MLNPNIAPPVEDPDMRQDQLDEPELAIAEMLITTRPEVLEMELLLMGGALAISALVDQIDD